MRTISGLMILIISSLLLTTFLQAGPPKVLKDRYFHFEVATLPNGTQGPATKIGMKSPEGEGGRFFIGQQIAIVTAGKVEMADKGYSITLQAIGAEKKRIHVGGTFEVLDPRFDGKGHLKNEALGSQSVSEVVLAGETIKVELDLTNENGKEYRVELKVAEVKEDTTPGS